MVCPNCGHTVDDNWEFCDSCGVKLTARESGTKIDHSQNSEKSIKKPSTTLLLLSISLLVIGAIVIWQAARLLKSPPPSDETTVETIPNQAVLPLSPAPTILSTPPAEQPALELDRNPAQPPDALDNSMIRLAFPSEYPLITAENAILVEEIARLSAGKYTVYAADGTILSADSVPFDSIWQVLVSSDGNLLILSVDSEQALLNLTSWELFLLEDVDGVPFTFSSDGQGLLTHFAGGSKDDGLSFYNFVSYYNFENQTSIPFIRSANLSEGIYRTDIFAFSPDNQRFAASFDSKSVQVWENQTGDLILDYPRSNDGYEDVIGLNFSPDSTNLAISYAHGATDRAALVSLKTGETVFTSDEKNRIKFFPTGNLILTSHFLSSANAEIWDLTTATRLGEIEFYSPGSDISAIEANPLFTQLSPENISALRQFLGLPNQTLGEVDRLSLKKADQAVFIRHNLGSLKSLIGHSAEVTLAQFTPDGSKIITHSQDNTLRIWGVHPSQLPNLLTNHQAKVQKVIFSPDGNFLASIDFDGVVWVWDAKTRSPLYHWQALSAENSDLAYIQFSEDGSLLLTSAFYGEKVNIWQVETQEEIFYLPSENSIFQSTLLSPTGDRLAVSMPKPDGGGSEWVIFNTKDESIFCRFEDQMGAFRLGNPFSAISSDGSQMAELSGTTSNLPQINLIDLDQCKREYSIPLSGLADVIFSPDGKLLTDGTSIWSTPDWQEQLKLTESTGQTILPLAFSLDGKNVALCRLPSPEIDGNHLRIEVFRLDDGTLISQKEIDYSPPAPESFHLGFAISPDLHTLALPDANRIFFLELP